MSTILGIVLVFFLGFAVGKVKIDKDKNEGERLVSELLKDKFLGPNYHLINDITLPTKDGTTQIDHVLISTKGIFVIETKHYNGWIFGNEQSRRWTQTFKTGVKNSFQNPIHQNALHVSECVKTLGNLPPHVFRSLVVFTGDGILKNGTSDSIKYLDQLESHIRCFSLDLISQDDVFKTIGKLEVYRKERCDKTDREHVEFLKRKHGLVDKQPRQTRETESTNLIKITTFVALILVGFLILPKGQETKPVSRKKATNTQALPQTKKYNSYSEYYLAREQKRKAELQRKNKIQSNIKQTKNKNIDIGKQFTELAKKYIVEPQQKLTNELIVKPYTQSRKNQVSKFKQLRQNVSKAQNNNLTTKARNIEKPYARITKCDEFGKNCKTKKFVIN